MEFNPHDKTRFENFNIITKVYKTVQGHPIDLDIFYSKNLVESKPPSCPILLRFHGGGLVGGSSLFPPFFAPWMLQLAERHSAIIVSPNYRLLPESSVKDANEDANDALRWTIEVLPSILAAETGLVADTSRIMTAGDSAGGYLSLQIGLSHPDKVRSVTAAYPSAEPESPHFVGGYEKTVLGLPMTPQNVFVDHMAKIRASSNKVIVSSDPLLERAPLMWAMVQHGLWGEFYPEGERSIFPLARLDDGDRFPRGGVLIWHGRQDTVVPFEQSVKVEEKVKKLDPSLEFRLVIRDGEHGFDHGVDINEDWAEEALSGVVKAWLS